MPPPPTRVTLLSGGLRLDAITFCAWLAQAQPGDRLEYHRGFLGPDSGPSISALPEPERRRIAALGTTALRAFEGGLVHLVQARLGPDCFAYLAIARPSPKATAISLSALLLDVAA